MIKKIAVIFLLCTSFSVFSQDVKKTLMKAFSAKTNDSSNYYFKKAKINIKTDADEAEYLFCKNARYADYNKPDSSLYYGQKALIKLKKLNNVNYQYYVYNNISKVYRSLGQYDKAIQNLLSGLKLAEANNNEYWKIHFCVNLSNNYHDFENYSKGIFYGEKAYNYSKNASKPDYKNICSALNVIAINYDDWNKPELALQYHKQVLSLAKGKDTLLITSTYNNIGNTLLKQKKYEESQQWLNKTIQLLDVKYKNKVKDDGYYYEYATIYTNLATIAFQLNKYDEADKMFEKAALFCKKSNSAEKLRDYYQQYYLYNKKKNNLQQTLESQENYIKLRDSVFKIERSKAVAEIETKYQTEKKEKELLLAKNQIIAKEAETKRKNLWLAIASIIAGFSILIGYLFFRQQKIRNQQQQQQFELKTALAKIETQNELQEQRLSISRDLHDNIGSQLTFVISSIENLKYGSTNLDPKIDSKLSQISTFTRSTITELRDTIWAMNNNEIKLEDLKARILNFLEGAKKAKENVDFEIDIDQKLENIKFSSLVWVNIYRTIQEAINNAIKYSEATKIKLNIQSVNNKIKIVISDNGKGFVESEIEKGNGLENMKKRIDSIQGDLKMESNKGLGTTIKIYL